MSIQELTREELTKEVDLVFKKRISHLKDEIGRRERCPAPDPEVQRVELAKYAYKLAVAILALEQLLDLIEEHMKI